MLGKVSVVVIYEDELNLDTMGSKESFQETLKLCREGKLHLIILSARNKAAVSRAFRRAEIKTAEVSWLDQGDKSISDLVSQDIVADTTFTPKVLLNCVAKQKLDLMLEVGC